MICVPSLMLGGILAESMPMSQAIWSGVIGYAVIVALMIFCGIMGSDLGVPTCVVKRLVKLFVMRKSDATN